MNWLNCACATPGAQLLFYFYGLPFWYYSINRLSNLMRHCFWMTTNSETHSKPSWFLIHAFSCLGSMSFYSVCVPSGDISTQLCFTVFTPAHEAQHTTADEQGIKKQMHWLIQSRTGKSIWWKTNLIIPRGILLLLVAKRLSPELPKGKTKFDTPAGKFHYDASEGFRWKQFLGE